MKKSKNGLFIGAVAVFTVVAVGTFLLQTQANKYTPPLTDSNYSQVYLHGKVVQAGARGEDGDRILKVQILGGEERNSVRDVTDSALNNYNDYVVGDSVYIYKSIDAAADEASYTVIDYYHGDGLFWVFVIFALVAVAVAGKKGARAIASVIVSLGLFYFLFIKLVGVGFSPVLAALLFVLIVTLITIPLIHGVNYKSLASIIAIFTGYAGSIVIVYLFNGIVRLGVAPGEEFRTLGVMFESINLFEILIASLFLGAVGALIDTAISISSAVFETLKEAPRTSFKKVYQIGMNVGKDILGSMINTLLFAYVASSLPFFVLLSLAQEGSDKSGFYGLLNMDFIALELTRTLIGAVSLVLLIPLVSLTSAYYLTKGQDR